MAKIIYNNILGLAPASTTRTNLKIGQEYHVANSFGMDPIKVPGIMQPGRTSSTNLDTGSKIAATVKKFIPYVGGSTPAFYSIEHGVKIHAQIALDGVVDDATYFSNFPLSITAHGGHSTPVIEDAVVYTVGSTNYLFTSWNDNTDGDVAQSTMTGGAHDTDFMSTVASGGAVLGKYPHPLLVAENGMMYIFDGPSIHKYDGQTGANGTFTATVIDLPKTWVFKDAIDYQGYAWAIAIEDFQSFQSTSALPARKAGVFLWNYINRKSNEFSGFSTKGPYIMHDIQDVGPIFVFNGVPHCFVINSAGNTELRRFTGSEFSPIWQEPGNIMPYKGGISRYYNHIMWAAKGSGTIYTYGKTGDGMPEVFNVLGSSGGSANGAMAMGTAGNLWIAYDTSMKLFTGTYSSMTITSLIKELPKLARVQSITLFYPPISDVTNSTMTLTFYRNFSTTAVSGTYEATHSTDGARGWKYFALGGKNFQNFNALRLHISYSLAGAATESMNLYRIEIEYEAEEKTK